MSALRDIDWSTRPLLFVRGIAAGACIALAVPPGGWWPLAFIGLGLWDRLIAGVSWKQRFRRTWLVCATWFFPTMLWMFDLTPPGYVIACISYAAYFGAAVACVPPGRARWFGFPGAVVLATLAMWTFPFGGVPLANLALTQSSSCAPPCNQIDSPLAQAARLAGPLLVVALVVVVGIALSAAWERRHRVAAIALAVVVVATALGFVAPRGHDVGSIRIAIIQGGGQQRTRKGNSDADLVFKAHLTATRELVHKPVDIILWPENTVSVDGLLAGSPQAVALSKLARDMDATVIAGVTEEVPKQPNFLNAAVVFNRDGSIGDRFDKVQRVPFGEYVPLRPIIEAVAGSSGIPSRDAIAGTGHGDLMTSAGEFGIVISWEDFFPERARDAIGHGGQILMNPTNGASYWLTQVQTQQIASSRLRAIETGRWETQAAPTGFSALITPDGDLLDRTDVSERRVIEATVPLREGDTISTIVGPWPMIALSLLGIALAWVAQRRSVGVGDGNGNGDDEDSSDVELAGGVPLEPSASLAGATASADESSGTSPG
jgi:apolipoprotein N-acyltransferase